ncbi:hypothetical protein K501DRAFT_274704 [Backusella circina FSU 941]|nr:hypothetical protein K501DRAFT_274704 [Backusella circina FSU 941]
MFQASKTLKEALSKNERFFRWMHLIQKQWRSVWTREAIIWGTCLVVETKRQKITAGVVKLLVSNRRLPLADLQKVFADYIHQLCYKFSKAKYIKMSNAYKRVMIFISWSSLELTQFYSACLPRLISFRSSPFKIGHKCFHMHI